MKRLKVLFVAEYWYPAEKGGGEISTRLLAEALSKQGVEMHVLTSKFPGLKESEIFNGVHIHRLLRTGKDPSSFSSSLGRVLFPLSIRRKLPILMRQLRPDIIHYLSPQAALGKVKTSVPSFIHVNSPVFFCPQGTLMYERHYDRTFLEFLSNFLKSSEFGKYKNRFYLKYNPFVWIFLYYSYKLRLKKLKQFDAYTPNSNFMKENLIQVGISRDKIHILPNIINIKQTSLKIKSNIPPHMVYLGAYVENKGILQLLQALKDVSVPYRFDFYGEGPLKQQMMDFVKKNSLDKKITVHDKIEYESSKDIIKNCDILVQPSLVAEAMPRAVLEAMAYRKLVISSDIGGAKDVIKHGVTGFLVAPDNIGSFRRCIEMALKDQNLRKRIGAAAQQATKSQKGEDIAKLLITVYLQVLRKVSGAEY